MDLGIVLQPTAAGLSAAAAAVIAGAPLFSDGLRALRLARGFRRLHEMPIADAQSGLTYVRGQVVLESPMFSPLSGTACAGFQLEVRSARGRVTRPILQFRPFRIVDPTGVAHVDPDGARFALSRAEERRVAPGEPLSQNLAALLERSAEVSWMRRSGQTLTITERVLVAGAHLHVVGTLRRSRIAAAETSELLERTGTDDAVSIVSEMVVPEPECWLSTGDHLDFLLVSDHPPHASNFRIAPLRIAGAFVGPVLSLGGLLMLAHAADRLRALGG